ncbi:MAG: DUF6037 family protein [Bifidobacterium crudilactis]|jgi:hypothetical protein|nr:DUF6037 family protein [Bifidobacterium crudilactis]MCI1889883.1 DUF6037 family protein [Bifidobacterium crudilactis]
MDLPVLTATANEVLEKHHATRFRWFFQDRYKIATFQAFFANTWERKDPVSWPTATLLLSQAGGVKNPWSHVFDIHKTDGKLWMRTYLGNNDEDIADYRNLMRLLHIEGGHGGEKWQAASFFGLMDSAASSVPGNWERSRIQQALDIPERLRRDIDDSKALYYLYTKAWRNGKEQSQKNYEKTRAIFDAHYADECRRLHASTCWTDNPKDKRIRPLPMDLGTVILD